MPCNPLFSMPHGKAIFFPFILVTVSFMMSFRTISTCDLIAVKWSIDCSSWYSSQCVFKSTLNLGLLAKETYIKPTELELDGNNQPKLEELTKVCQWYTREEREWLLSNNLWEVITLTQFSVTFLALIGMLLIGITTCYAFKRLTLIKSFSILFGFCSIASALPLLLQYKSDFCTINEGSCNESQTMCVSSCSWGIGSWLSLATSFLWISTACMTWLVRPARHDGKNEIYYNDESSYETDHSGSSSHGDQYSEEESDVVYDSEKSYSCYSYDEEQSDYYDNEERYRHK